jgi:putative Mg2+ transporter-C (MgtC) family protein
MSLATDFPELVIVGRVAIATVIGLGIGLERHQNGKIAGVRTYSTIALATALFTLIGIHFFDGEHQVFVLSAIIIGLAVVSSKISVIDNDGVPEFSNMVALWATGAISISIAYGLYILGGGTAFILLAIYLVKDFIEEKNN